MSTSDRLIDFDPTRMSRYHQDDEWFPCHRRHREACAILNDSVGHSIHHGCVNAFVASLEGENGSCLSRLPVDEWKLLNEPMQCSNGDRRRDRERNGRILLVSLKYPALALAI